MEGEYSCDEEDDNITSVSQIVRDNNEIDISQIEEEEGEEGEGLPTSEDQSKIEDESKTCQLNPISIPAPKLANSQEQFKVSEQRDRFAFLDIYMLNFFRL